MTAIGEGEESDLKFRSFAHAWATGIITAALMGSEAFTVKIRSDAPEVIVRIGSRAFRLIIEELQVDGGSRGRRDDG